MRDNPHLLTLPQLLSAKKKIGKVAAGFDSNKVSLRGFDSESLSPTEFREQLRRNFELQLTDAELGAIVLLCDKDDNGMVNSSEFLSEFLRLGKIERTKQYIAKKLNDEKFTARKLKHSEDHENRHKTLVDFSISRTWSEKDEKGALRKLSKVAFYYDKHKHLTLQGFLDGGLMNLGQFKDQLRRNFDLKLSAPEFGALCHMFRAEGANDQYIDCDEFLFQFSRMGREEKARYKEKQAADLIKMREKEQAFSVGCSNNGGNANAANSLLGPSTEEDRDSALQKIRMSAYNYDPDRHVGLKAFEAAYLDVSVFREQLKLSLDVALTNGELKAMVSLFGQRGDGRIHCLDFVATFNRLGDEERMRIETQQHLEHARHEARKAQIQAAIEERARKRRQTRVKWPILPADEKDGPDGDDEGGSDGSEERNIHFPVIEKHRGSSWSAPLSTESRGSASMSKSLKRRKPTLQETLSRSKLAMQLNKKKVSLTALFPKASSDVKNFICDIEKKEKEIKKMKSSSSKFSSHRRTVTTKFENSNSDGDKQMKTKETRGKGKRTQKLRDSTCSISDYEEFENCHEMGQMYLNEEDHRMSDHLNDVAHGFVGPDHSGYEYEEHSDYSPDEYENSTRSHDRKVPSTRENDKKESTWGETQFSEKSDIDSSKYQSEFDSDS